MTALHGSGLLIGLALRRDRWMLPSWIAAVVATVAATVGAFDDLYPDQASRDAFAGGIRRNPVFRAFYGPLFSSTSNGGLTAWRLGTVGAVMLALMSVFVVTRHTRQEEEAGRSELVGATAVGRSAPLAAALVVAAGADLAAGLLCTGVLVAAGEQATGAVVFGLGLAGVGLVFGGVAAVAAQLSETARAANSLATAALGAAFLLRAVGDSSEASRGAAWLSPLSWAQQTRAFADNRAAFLLALPAAAVALAAVAGMLHSRRDVGSSLVRTRPGAARAHPLLSGAYGLSARRHRGAVLGWAPAFLLLGSVFGALADSIGELAGSSPQIAEMLRRIGGPGVLVDGYLSGVLGVVALFASGFAVSAALRLRTEETALLVEPVLAAAVSRWRLLAAQWVWVFGASALMMLLAGAAAGAAADVMLADGSDHLPATLVGAAVQIPAVWVVGGVAVLLVGVLPRWAAAAWAVLGVCALLEQVGPVLDLPQAILNLSPFAAVPRVVGNAEVPATPLIALTVVAAGLAGAGAVGFRRRDIG